MPVIKIESILGGQASTTHFAGKDQFRASLGIDPRQSIDENSFVPPVIGQISSGLLRPVSCLLVGTTIAGPIKWFINEPKNGATYAYNSVGSAYTVTSETITELADGGTLSNSTGNGMVYYDNYIYFAKETDIARYGPLNGVKEFTGTYWTGTLGKAALVSTIYPQHDAANMFHSNHYLHRHSDGRLYIADVVDNKGTIHYIETTKTVVEGDTNNGSTANKLQFGYGLWPMCMETYGNDLVIALIENLDNAIGVANGRNAKIAFWDTTSTNFNKIIWVEFPDQIITAIKNVNGVLYVISGSQSGEGSSFRLSRFVGGYSFEEVYYTPSGMGELPLAGAIDVAPHRISIGVNTSIPEYAPCVFSFDIQGVSKGLFNTMRGFVDSDASQTAITALSYAFVRQKALAPVIAVTSDNNHFNVNVQINEVIGTSSRKYNNAPSVWWSQLYRIGQPFKITKIRIPLAQAIATNMIVTPKIYTDEGAGTIYTLTAINDTNDSGKFNIVRRTDSNSQPILGQHNFWLELRWTGAALCTVGLPISIEFELLDD